MERVRKFSSSDCLTEAIRRVNEDHSLIRNHVKIFTDTQNNLLVRVLWPAVFDETAWQRTDKEVRTYENEVWTDNDQVLEVVVTTEHGEFVEVTFNVKWN
jgi:hypothetical protein